MSRVVRSTVCALAILLSQAPELAAKVVHVNCGSAKINDALQKLDPAESNTIRVSGTCNEFVNITDFAQLTITAASKSSEIAGIHGTSAGSLLWIVRSHVQISNLLLDGGQWGVMCQDFSVCAFTGTRSRMPALRVCNWRTPMRRSMATSFRTTPITGSRCTRRTRGSLM